jgi:hypothetical protein
MAITTSPNMLLPVPIVGQEAGPQYAIDIDSCLSLIDTHDHSPGKGVQITNAGLNITSALTINSNSLINARSVLFTPQTLFTSPSDNGSIYEAANGDLYYRGAIGAGAGINIQLTSGSTIAGTPGNISGLVSPASASYNPGASTFTFQSNTNTAANIDGGSFILRDITSGSNGITISPPSGLAANYTLTLPAATPAQQDFMTMDSAGNIAALWHPDNTTLVVTSNVLSVGTVQLANMGASSVGTSQIVANSITNAKLATANAVNSASSGAFGTSSTSFVSVTNLSINITTAGRPVMLVLRSDNSGAVQAGIGGSNGPGQLRFVSTTGGVLGTMQVPNDSNPIDTAGLPPSAFSVIDFPSAGTYTYYVQVAFDAGFSGSTYVYYTELLAIEL